eukprot:CAMPEP_0185751556 /NCGR_PEP_ID=MMETSP1174-20130828/10336_1 /TAXON_ID=35687 /ORGANISM="Dictyocha speculum, Strain CCMP1381" /LENGTH=167 /DNA_ID=CAMNT_0028428591 /DNA_START=446 /DNA_END=946 /DNA_ORIENTATION=+
MAAGPVSREGLAHVTLSHCSGGDGGALEEHGRRALVRLLGTAVGQKCGVTTEVTRLILADTAGRVEGSIQTADTQRREKQEQLTGGDVQSEEDPLSTGRGEGGDPGVVPWGPYRMTSNQQRLPQAGTNYGGPNEERYQGASCNPYSRHHDGEGILEVSSEDAKERGQ